MARRRLRRTWPQRFVIVLNSALVLACLAAAAIVWYGNNRLGALERVDITTQPAPTFTSVLSAGGSGVPTTEETLPVIADVDARNFLLVGSDSRDCIDPDSPYAGAFLNTDEEFDGSRTDTIMVLRVDPKANQAAILSFPRDLWVRLDGTNRKGRINQAFDQDDPAGLVRTIALNFKVPIDHYVEVDFCAFKSIVDSVGGVRVPFEYPARDKNTGLNVAAGCVTFTGDGALAYVRSRHYEWFDGKKWRRDDSSDFGRIKRQQDFMKRALQRAIDLGARRPAVAKDLLDAALENVRVDTELTIRDLLGLSSQLRTFDPRTVRTFRLDGTPTVIGGAQVIIPDTTSRSAKRLFQVFRGEAFLADLPDQPDATTTTVADDTPATTSAAATIPVPTAPPTTTLAPTTLLPSVEVTDNNDGIYPPDDPTCR
jgi:LCP family protein required for cell wall assembly